MFIIEDKDMVKILLGLNSASLIFITLFQSTFSEHSCTPNRFYCGSQLQQVSQTQRVQNTTLWQCGSDGKSLTFSYYCTSGCKVVQEGDSYCLCMPNKRYCGHELNDIGWQANENSLYNCVNEGLNASLINTCAYHCKAASHGQSYCFKQCEDGKNYCVCELRKLGWDGYERSSLYSCRGGKEASILSSCALCDSGDTWDFTPDQSSETTSSDIEQEGCRKCFRLYGKPTCRHEFSMSWFVGGIAALVVFTLGLLLIRIILQHRRLKRLTREPIPLPPRKRCELFTKDREFVSERKIIDMTQLTVSKKLGQGVFGDVWKGTYTNSEGKHNVALKLSKWRTDAMSCFLQEVMILDVISHENIIKVFDVCLNFIDEGGNSVPALVLEYMNGGSAISYMRSERNRLNGRDLLHIFLDICQAGNHLCKLGFIHRDIGAHNVLVQNNPQTGHVTVAKLTDFRLVKDNGKLARMYKDTSHYQPLRFRHLAPEGFELCFCFKSDVWSFGVFMWELYTVMEEEDVLAEIRLEQGKSGPLPYSELYSVPDVLAEACSEHKLKQPRMAPENMYNIMRQCWSTKPDSRPSFEELINSFTINGNGSIIEPKVIAVDVRQLKTIKLLGEGEFGEVWQGTYAIAGDYLREVAMKFPKSRTDAVNCFQQEVLSLDIVSHRNIITAFGICLNFNYQYGNTVPALVLEYMNGGSAISYMRSERNRLNGRDLLHIFLDICYAGDHLCKLGIIHRDIGARNVLVQKDPHTGHVVVAKLTDFGLAKDIGKLTNMYKAANLDQNMFHFRYTAPEGFRGCFCSKSDVWSFGVFMWELYKVMEEHDALADLRLEQGRSGPMPYSGLDTVAYVFAEACGDRKLKQPRMAPEQMYKIMRQCWEAQEELRPSFKELIRFFRPDCYGREILAIATGSAVSDKISDPKTGHREKQMGNNGIPDGYVGGLS